MVRDQALTASGLLAETVGGPSVMPPQPEGVWRTVYSNLRWETPTGPDRYRRALYTYWRRTSPYPSMLMFDAPSREFCSARRVATNTPLQALVTLNDPVYLECAQALAERAQAAAGEDPSAAIDWMVEAVVQRKPTELTNSQLRLLYDAATAAYDPNSSDQHALSDSADGYALTVVASTILNFDTALTK
jgi:hypothetical protein